MEVSIIIISFLSTLLIALLTHLLTARRERERVIEANYHDLDKSLSEIQGRLLVIESEIRYITENLIFRTVKTATDVDAAHDKIRVLEGVVK